VPTSANVGCPSASWATSREPGVRYTASTDDRDTSATFRPPMEATTLAGFTAEAVAEGYDLA
jgi:hypothetical protein